MNPDVTRSITAAEASRPAAPARPLPRGALQIALVLGALAFTLAFGVRYFLAIDDPHFAPRIGLLRVHILFGAIPLVLGPLQFIDRIRITRPVLHRANGRIYAACILVAAIAGLLLALNANGGIVGRVGFAGLAIAWLVTTGVAVAAILARRITRHRRWMLRSYVVTLAFVWVRLILGPGLLAGVDEQLIFAIAAWASWLVPLGILEIVLRRRSARVTGRSARA